VVAFGKQQMAQGGERTERSILMSRVVFSKDQLIADERSISQLYTRDSIRSCVQNWLLSYSASERLECRAAL